MNSRQCEPNLFQHRFGLLEYLVVPETQNMNALVFEERASALVINLRGRCIMLTTVQLNRELFLVAVEIENVVAEGVLATELAVRQTPVA